MTEPDGPQPQPAPPTAPKPKTKTKLTKVALVFVWLGGIWAVLTGGCTAYFAIPLLAAPSTDTMSRQFLGLVLLVGGVPFLIGLVVVALAVRLGRKKEPNIAETF